MPRTQVAALSLLLLVVAIGVSADGGNHGHEDHGGDHEPCACTMEWNPQCDPVTNITYGSPSCARCAGPRVAARVIPGECPDDTITDPRMDDTPSCACTMEFNPQCDPTTNITYGNPCVAKCAGAEVAARVTPGECPEDSSPCFCTLEFNPQCDPVTNITYGSPSCARCAGPEVAARIIPGECPDDKTTDPVSDDTPSCACTRELNPQCDPTTNITYSNPCLAKCAGAEDRVIEGACSDEPTDSTCFCITLYDPVCGEDGKTYSNACFAACAGAGKTKPGECKPKSEIELCEESCNKEDMNEICAIFIDHKPSLRKKGGKGKQITKTVSYASSCIGACNGITKAAGTYQGPCDAKADKACAAGVTSGLATCVSLADDGGFAEVPSTCYAEKLFGSDGSVVEGSKAGCSGKAALSIFEGTPCLRPSTIRCFANPCDVSTCSVEGALCASNYCDRLYRGTILPAGCSAIWLDPATGGLIESCMA